MPTQFFFPSIRFFRPQFLNIHLFSKIFLPILLCLFSVVFVFFTLIHMWSFPFNFCFWDSVYGSLNEMSSTGSRVWTLAPQLAMLFGGGCGTFKGAAILQKFHQWAGFQSRDFTLLPACVLPFLCKVEMWSLRFLFLPPNLLCHYEHLVLWNYKQNILFLSCFRSWNFIRATKQLINTLSHLLPA